MPTGLTLERIVLAGFMGAGKSTVGRLLAPLLGWRFYDVDAVLSTRAGLSVPAIFTRYGESHFRSLEANAVRSLLGSSGAVLALGGGALEHPETRSRVLSTPGTLLVYLHTTLATSIERCRGDQSAVERPVLRDLAAAESRYHARTAGYAQAHLTVETEGVESGAVARTIVEAARNLGAIETGSALE